MQNEMKQKQKYNYDEKLSPNLKMIWNTHQYISSV